MDNSNYYSSENAIKFMSASQFKGFRQCPAKTVAEIYGKYKRKSETALLVGSYVDAYFEGTLNDFKENHPEVFLKTGGLKAEFRKAEECIARATSDEYFMHMMSGEKQKIVTGTIANVEFKGKLDSYIPNEAIVDLKCMKSAEMVWDEKQRKKIHFIEAWGYDIQLAIYQELIYQETKERLRCYIAVVTKEDVPDIQVLEVPQERLDECLMLVETKAEYYQNMKDGYTEPFRCEKCDYCKATKKLTRAIPYTELNPELYSPKSSFTSLSEQPALKIPIIPAENEETESEFTELKVSKKKKKHKKKGKVVVIKL